MIISHGLCLRFQKRSPFLPSVDPVFLFLQVESSIQEAHLKFVSFAMAFVCLAPVSFLTAQNSVTLYQLGHKPGSQARRLVEKGMAALKQKKYNAGLALLQRAVVIDPEYWRAQNNLGYAYLKLNRNHEATEAFQRAINLDPQNPIGYTNLATCALIADDYPLAEKSAARALRLGPDLEEAKALFGIARAAQGDWGENIRKLLEESRSVRAAGMLLKKWPSTLSEAPRLLVLSSSR